MAKKNVYADLTPDQRKEQERQRSILQEEDKGEMKRLNILIDESRYRRFKALAAQEGKSMTEIIKSFIDTYVKEQST